MLWVEKREHREKTFEVEFKMAEGCFNINLPSKSAGHLDCARCDISRKGIRSGTL